MHKFSPGNIIKNRYEVVSRPLIGGMGIVYLCMDLQKEIPVALKTFQPQFLKPEFPRLYWMILSLADRFLDWLLAGSGKNRFRLGSQVSDRR